ncbi:hypothetical protein [Actinoplanes utahensis]|uniref:hypothetical protein n=1 Tax=Actinoplanes utahensis TaxID=1869 RepID=UPI001F3BB922|nr:hypothetical protein [Actinoplanes utahensis]
MKLTADELRRLFHALVIEPVRRVADVIAWSIFRRRHQAGAMTNHYDRRSLIEPGNGSSAGVSRGDDHRY